MNFGMTPRQRQFVLPLSRELIVDNFAGGEARGGALDQPIGTQTTENRHALIVAFLAKHYGGVVGSPLGAPIGTVTAVDHHSLVSSCLLKFRGSNVGHAADEPIATISAQGTHHALVKTFLTKYYGSGDGAVSISDPMPTVTSRDRFGLVTARGENYAIADIGLRMLAPHELFRAQGFPVDYIIDRGDFGGTWRPLTKTAQVRMCGNSVCPPVAAAVVLANAPEMAVRRAA